jgi:TetR/AcrR family tetracycline transcriptional repressor
MAPRTTLRGPLSRGEIVRTALQLAERHGLEKLSLHKVAQAVGVKTMSLYNHVADKADVLDAMADQIMAEMIVPDLDSVGWEDGLRTVSTAFRDAAMRYPHSAPLVLTRRLNAPSVLPIVESALRLLRRAGLGTAEAVHVLRAYIAFLVGSVLREVGTPTSSESELTNAGLPTVAEAADVLAICDHEYELQFGLDLLLESVRARAATTSKGTA